MVKEKIYAEDTDCSTHDTVDENADLHQADLGSIKETAEQTLKEKNDLERTYDPWSKLSDTHNYLKSLDRGLLSDGSDTDYTAIHAWLNIGTSVKRLDALGETKDIPEWSGTFQVEWQLSVGAGVQHDLESAHYNAKVEAEEKGAAHLDSESVTYGFHVDTTQSYPTISPMFWDYKPQVSYGVARLGGLPAHALKGAKSDTLSQLHP